ncbi:glucose-1-phosphate cytidylyltransferase [Bradyrhizobium sp. WSM2254]|uniref:glucose-1-phosphate cytidylyltransferase n=1 Tax=Bradyrhizobium sp. WSM2254 TaxID=1188263 RepID=UPI000412B3DC|nr:glucose-1-phosphate cytidylyltransferase [Bradyrhizobium sp. WSM2254]
MKAVILAGGFGTRITEESHVKPKPMIEIGGKPILWHIMKIFSSHGIDEFIICCGYKSYVIKEYFANYFLHMADVTFDLANNSMEVHNKFAEHWKVTLVDTGLNTMTGGRLKRIRDYVGNETFCMTYGDGLADVDIGALREFHRAHGRHATVTAIQPPARFGALDIDHDVVQHFEEKPRGDGRWINGGFFVLEPAIFDYLGNDATIWEQEPLKRLSQDGQLAAYRHTGFWEAMDTLRDKLHLEQLWDGGRAPWKRWQ